MDKPSPTFALTLKPYVAVLRDDPKFKVYVTHTRGTYDERWRTHEAAMNCCRAIARTSAWAQNRREEP